MVDRQPLDPVTAGSNSDLSCFIFIFVLPHYCRLITFKALPKCDDNGIEAQSQEKSTKLGKSNNMERKFLDALYST